MLRNTHATALVLYEGKIPEDGKPTKSQINCVLRLCENGSIKSAFKIGKRWLTDLEKDGEIFAAERSSTDQGA